VGKAVFWQATFFSAANSAMAFYAISLGRPGAAVVCIVASAVGCAFAGLVKRRVARSV
jgi:hypothetical protein